MQRNWIGRSTGASVEFATAAGDVEVFTTRPDTLVRRHLPGRWLPNTSWWMRWSATPGPRAPIRGGPSVRRRRPKPSPPTGPAIAAKSDLERQENKTKTGVFLGAYATNPVNGQQVPVFIADYVLAGYGTGAIMAVPGGDQRDWDFATEFGLPDHRGGRRWRHHRGGLQR